MKLILNVIVFVCILSPAAVGAEAYTSEYVGETSRQIKSLSPADIETLKTGGGWGLAKVAELNGMPGPAHVLQMRHKINLTDEQARQIQALFNQMKTQAIPLGERLIELEAALNQGFSQRTVTPTSLEQSVDAIAKVRAQLRRVHLSAHLKTPEILSKEQIQRYNALRGYAKDPCANIPEGHHAAMWKKHNGCE